jgi:uncharacterized protein YigA (DUF484 family)
MGIMVKKLEGNLDKEAPVAAPSLEDEIAEYLRHHPDFLVRHPEVLEAMEVPGRWNGDGVVDMQQFMLQRLRSEINDLRNSTLEVIETSRSNMSSQTRAHASVLAILAASDFEQMIRVVTYEMPLLLDVDVVTIGFEPAVPPLPDLTSPEINEFARDAVDGWLGEGKNVALVHDLSDDGTIFGGGAGLVRSAALARLQPGHMTPTGLLALGSRGNAFYPGQGTELIRFLARMLERCVHGWQEQPA